MEIGPAVSCVCLAGWTKLKAGTGMSSRNCVGGKNRRTGKTRTDSKGRIRPVTFVRFYDEVCYGRRYVDRRYEPLRAALRDAERFLGRHPALAPVLKVDERWKEFVVRAFDRDYGTSRLAVVAGLLCRARQVGENGLETACRELQSLLDRSLEEECGSASDLLTTGYHVLALLRPASQRRGRNRGQSQGGSAGEGGRRFWTWKSCGMSRRRGTMETGGKASAQL